MDYVLETLFFVENFTEYRQSSALFAHFMKDFIELKSAALSDSVKGGQNKLSSSFEIATIRHILR